ncbi:MAG: hypothetical protein LKF52_03540 [Butyrivibrio sp.]|jgi:hypothetical protein|nr:hypothetical protein [Butyrivibrio sp.]
MRDAFPVWVFLLNTESAGKNGFGMFTFYTVDSNIFAMVVCTVYAAFLIRRAISEKKIPEQIQMAKYMAVCCLTVTFLMVVLVLAPMVGKDGYQILLLSGEMKFHHLLCPLLAGMSFFLSDHIPFKPGKAARVAILPTAGYAAVTVILNLLHIISGPYPFLKVYEQPVAVSVLWFALIFCGAYGVAWGIAEAAY